MPTGAGRFHQAGSRLAQWAITRWAKRRFDIGYPVVVAIGAPVRPGIATHEVRQFVRRDRIMAGSQLAIVAIAAPHV